MTTTCCTMLLLSMLVAAALAAPKPQQPHPVLPRTAAALHPRPRFLNPHARVSRFDPDQIMMDVGKMTKGFNEMHPVPAFNNKEQQIYDQTFKVMDDMASKFDFGALYDDE